MDRRQFLKYNMQGALYVAAGAAGFMWPSTGLAGDNPEVVIVEGDPAKAAKAAVERLGGMKKFVKPGDRVVIKPNMSFAQPLETGTNTHPQVVRAIAVMCREAGAKKVMILDHPLHRESECVRLAGIQAACQGLDGVEVHMLTSQRLFAETKLPAAQEMLESEIAREVLRSQVLIAAPVAKSHADTGVSLGMKGMMGLIYHRHIMHRRYSLDNSIVDLCTRLKANLSVVDASRVLTSGGPAGPGYVLQAKTIIASPDMVAADAATVALFPWYGKRKRPEEIEHLAIAHKRGLGRIDIEKMKVQKVKL
jgi:uncharacterized protein (DUF362 family)